VTGFREKIRNTLPFTTDIYEFVISRKAMSPSKKKFETLLKQGNPICLDLGGADAGAGDWTTVDMTKDCDIFWDLRLPIPLPEKSVSKIYSSHLFEHLTYAEGQALLAESMRLLKPGGTFSICVPNARIYVEHYLGIKAVPDDYFGWEPAFNRTTPIDAINYVAYMDGEHKYMFDQENLLHILSAAGFVGVRPRDYDAETDRLERHYESLYAIATKP
jgi:predicted SAM-dependent methyltransferase